MRCSCRPADIILTAISAIGILGLAGCATTGPMQAEPASYAAHARVSARPGRVYVLRGFGDVFSEGMNTITDDLVSDGVAATVHRHGQWQEIANQIIRDRQNVPAPSPLVLIGHSWGADDSIRIAGALLPHHIRVNLLITVEAVTPPAVPTNVLRAWNIYKPQPLDFLPWWRGVPVHVERRDQTQLTQIDISRDWPAINYWWLGHTDVDTQAAVQDRIVSLVLSACPAKDAPDAH